MNRFGYNAGQGWGKSRQDQQLRRPVFCHKLKEKIRSRLCRELTFLLTFHYFPFMMNGWMTEFILKANGPVSARLNGPVVSKFVPHSYSSFDGKK